MFKCNVQESLMKDLNRWRFIYIQMVHNKVFLRLMSTGQRGRRVGSGDSEIIPLILLKHIMKKQTTGPK